MYCTRFQARSSVRTTTTLGRCAAAERAAGPPAAPDVARLRPVAAAAARTRTAATAAGNPRFEPMCSDNRPADAELRRVQFPVHARANPHRDRYLERRALHALWRAARRR